MNPQPIAGAARLAVDFKLVAHAARMRLDSTRRGRTDRTGRPGPGVGELARRVRSHLSLGRALRDKKYVRFGDHVYFDAFSPRFPGPVFDRVIAASVRRFVPGAEPQPSGFIPYVVLAITDRCVYRCEHCYAKDVIRSKDTLSLDQLKHIVDRFQDIGTGVFGLEGGEPLLRFDDLIALCEHARERSEIWIATTGWGLTASRARRLAAAGLAGAAISLDHYDPERHNAFRGNPKAFDEAAKAVALFNQAGVLPALAVCATRDVIADGGLYRYLELARDLGAGVVQVLDPVPTGNFIGKPVGLSEPELRQLQRFQREVNTSPRYRDYPAVSTRPSLEDDTTFGCGAGGNAIIYVDPSGNLQPCPFLGASTGNLIEDGFDQPLSRMRRLFPHPAAVGVSCPVAQMGAEIADARGRCGKLPLPYHETAALCRGFADAPLPEIFAGQPVRRPPADHS